MSGSVERTTYPGLDGRVIVLRMGDLVDAVLVRTARFDVLVDTLDRPETCRDALALRAEARQRPLVVVNSHFDWDHVWGNAAVGGAPIVAHAAALQRVRDPATRAELDRKTREDPRFASVELVAPTVTISGATALQGGDLTLELIHTPGHTPDHLAVWIPEIRVCLAVDAAERPIPAVWSDDPADLGALVASLERIQALGADHVVLAHGRTSAPATVADNLRYFAALAERVEALDRALDANATPLPEGLRLGDIVALPHDMPPDARAFYETCHRRNLRATLRRHGRLQRQ